MDKENKLLQLYCPLLSVTIIVTRCYVVNLCCHAMWSVIICRKWWQQCKRFSEQQVLVLTDLKLGKKSQLIIFTYTYPLYKSLSILLHETHSSQQHTYYHVSVTAVPRAKSYLDWDVLWCAFFTDRRVERTSMWLYMSADLIFCIIIYLLIYNTIVIIAAVKGILQHHLYPYFLFYKYSDNEQYTWVVSCKMAKEQTNKVPNIAWHSKE